jgi:hypothetical protein
MRWGAAPWRRRHRDAVSWRRDAAGDPFCYVGKASHVGTIVGKGCPLAQIAMSGETLGVMLEEVAMPEEIGMLKKDLSLTLYRVKFLIVWMLCRKKEGGRERGR